MKPARSFAGKTDLQYRLEGDVLYLYNRLTIAGSEKLSVLLLPELLNLGPKALTIDLSGLDYIDSTGVSTLYYLERMLEAKGTQTRFAGGNEQVRDKMQLFSPDTIDELWVPRKAGLFERIGMHVQTFFTSYVMGFVLLAANMSYWAALDVFRKKTRRPGEVVNQSVLIGVNAVLIIVFLSFVIGFVMALHAAGQLRTFGANIFIVDLVVISIMSQMGPLITAILVAGRSGSAIAAEIATMKVTAELDALKTMGLNPIRFVVVPKLYASLLTMPFLVILADVAGIAGGALSANIYLDISPEIFINRMAEVMKNKDLVTGFVKSQVYATLIVLTGSFYGLRVVRGAEGVGKAATIAVVVSITLVILADSILGLIFY